MIKKIYLLYWIIKRLYILMSISVFESYPVYVELLHIPENS